VTSRALFAQGFAPGFALGFARRFAIERRRKGDVAHQGADCGADRFADNNLCPGVRNA
jgi:hypothetical protein